MANREESRKELSNLIAEMVKDEAFAKEVLADPSRYEREYNLTPRNVQALKASSLERLVGAHRPVELADGGCYYGG